MEVGGVGKLWWFWVVVVVGQHGRFRGAELRAPVVVDAAAAAAVVRLLYYPAAVGRQQHPPDSRCCYLRC